MKKILFLLFALFYVGLTPALLAQDEDITLEEVLENYHEAIGQDKIAEMSTMVTKGKMMMGPMEIPIKSYAKRPSFVRQEGTFQGMSFITAYDGETGWGVNPFAGSKEPEPMPEDALKSMKIQADFDGVLMNYEEKGYTVTLEGTEEYEGSDVYQVKVVIDEDTEQMLFIDVDSYMLLKVAGKSKVQGNEVEVETIFGNYKQVEGIALPFSIETKAKGAPTGQQMVIEEYLFGEEVKEDLFKMPETDKAEDKEVKEEMKEEVKEAKEEMKEEAKEAKEEMKEAKEEMKEAKEEMKETKEESMEKAMDKVKAVTKEKVKEMAPAKEEMKKGAEENKAKKADKEEQ